MDTEVHSQPRVNSARLDDFIGRKVRLVCKVERVTDNSVIVLATDSGQIEVKVPMEEENLRDFVELICTVEDSNTVKMHACIPLGENLDMNLVNDCIEMTHDPRFQNIF